jgi:RNA polymerase sigma-70 factor (ECF subfamily)
MSQVDSFDELMARLKAGDQGVETLVFRRYVQRLIALAGRQFDAELRDRADVEGVVQSACKSFFLRQRRGEFELDGWDELWSMLATITLRKCANRRDYLRASRRNARREASWTVAAGEGFQIPDRAPTPLEAAIFSETFQQFIESLGPADRPIVQQILMGYTAEEVAKELDCSERTVRRVRQRAKQRLLRLIGGGSHDEEAP